ncbi:MAG: DnaD domain protein [Bacilli bacterium]|nr:DnaD domain protein [Bacilli bacterium]
MKTKKLMDLMKSGNFVISKYLYKNRDKFDLDFETYIFLIYLTNINERFLFDAAFISEDLNMDVYKVMEMVSVLKEKQLLNLEIIKNDRNIREEYITLKPFYEKLSSITIDEINNISNKEETIDIFKSIEKGFCRPLSPIEFEIIKAWLDGGVKEELIEEALKETVFNGVSNLRYMDKIIYEWTKKGFKTKEDVEKSKSKFREEQTKKEKEEYFDFDWFDEDE